jgi:histidinol-phosphate/aromatic aminotransferase/cobyric acid decarboxylase-like protein
MKWLKSWTPIFRGVREIVDTHRNTADVSSRVIYMGTFSKTMFPALRVGYLVVPDGPQGAFTTAIRLSGHTVSLSLQSALADRLRQARPTRQCAALWAPFGRCAKRPSAALRSLELAPLARIAHRFVKEWRRTLDSQEIVRVSGILIVFPSEKNFLWIQGASQIERDR